MIEECKIGLEQSPGFHFDISNASSSTGGSHCYRAGAWHLWASGAL